MEERMTIITNSWAGHIHASEDIKKMCDQILTNPLIEDYSFVIEKI